MIKRFTFGNPFKTEACVENISPCMLCELPAEITLADNNASFSIPLGKTDIIYGLGESLHGMNKRGFVYICNNTDQTKHDENQYSLYGSHSFVLIDRFLDGKLALFVDYPSTITFDIGFTDKDLMRVTISEPNYDLYTIEGTDGLEIVKEFRSLIGQSYEAPLFAFGYAQSRWGYKCTDDISEVVRMHRENHLPLDTVCMDIDYMTDYKVFTIDPEKFPNFKDFVGSLKAQGIHLCPNVDPGVKVDDSFDMYKEGVQNNYFCKDASGNDFLTAVWPGKTVLPDFFKDDVRKWFGEKYRVFTDAGVDAFWNDMNEPALFYSINHLNEVANELTTFKAKTDTLTLGELWDFLGKVSGLANNPEDYKSFYHETNVGKVRHDKVHNIYAHGMVKSAAEAFKKLVPGQNVLLYSRASYIGQHRYGGIWTGDNSSFYSHIELLIHQLPGLNMAGFIYSGADTGGFAFHTSEDLLMRFMEVSMFTPLFRNHCALGCRDQEIYRFKDIDSFRNLLMLRYAMIPYLYNSYLDSCRNGKLLFTPLSLAFPNDFEARNVEDQLMVGDSIMIAPVYKSNSTGRSVYIPCNMRAVRFRSPQDYDVCDLEPGHHYITTAINEVCVFIKDLEAFYLVDSAENTAELDMNGKRYRF